MQASLFSTHSGRLAAWVLSALLLVLGLRPQVAQATHIQAGDIQSKVDSITHNPNHIYFKLTLYCNPDSPAKQEDVDIFFGDNTRQNGIKKAQNITVNAFTHIYTYYFDHIFPGPRATPYIVSFVGENRVTGIININGGNSVGQTFYINAAVTIDPTLGLNHSPVLRAPAIDQGAVGQVFLHNPAAYDADGDSLAFSRLNTQQVPGGEPAAPIAVVTPTPSLNYSFPDAPNLVSGAKQMAFEGIPVGNPATVGKPGDAAIYYQDPYNGQIVWNAPAQAGVYNVAIQVREYRRYPKGSGIPPRLIGTVIRDMQITINNASNLRPQITVPPDLCVQAGQPVTLTVSAVDGQAAGVPPTPLSLFAYSGILPPATFTQNNTGTSVTGTFRWTPDCNNVSNQPYTVLFKVQDGPQSTVGTLIDEKPVRITVVGPPPQNLKAQSFNTSAVLTWDSYRCTNASNILIFRREGCYAYNPGPCDTGLPASAGYVQVGSVPATATTFTDSPLNRGTTYSYRIYAVFPLPAGGASIVSNEACLQFAGRSALLTNVDINTTDPATGQITVKWTRPRADDGSYNLPAPYGYRLSRAEGLTGAFTQIAEIRNSLNDTTFVDTGRNTQDVQYRYQLEFFRTNTINGSPAEAADAPSTASSVRTSLVGTSGVTNSIVVNFAYTVPWDNSKLPARIYRRTGTTGTYTQIATVTPGSTTGTYTDADPSLQRGQTYCYYVQTTGQYATPVNSAGQPEFTNLLNKSQEVCAVLRPIPCTPVLSLRVINCDSLAALPRYPADNQTYANSLSWTVGTTPAGCEANAVYYRIFRATTTAGPFALIDSTAQLSYLNRPLSQQNYCYQVQGVTATGERTALSNIVCQSECVFFILPNIFVPGSEVAANRVFRPKTTSPITRTHIQIFNRWGRKVYESDQDPYINWTGGGVAGESNSSGLVADGIYYYLAEVEFADSNHTKRNYKGWVEIVRQGH